MHLHEVRDTDSHYVIDPITREITNANSAKNRLMQGDHNSEIYTFEIPRLVEGHDMTLCNAIRIHYNDISADKANESKDFYPVKDMHIDEDQTDTLVFSWLVSGNATKYAGLLSFRIQFLCIDDSGNVTYKWHTDIFKGITISDGFDNSDAAIEEYSDIIAKWEADIFGAGDSVMANIEAKASEQIVSIEEARRAAAADVQAKGQEALESIPDEYNDLYKMAYDAVRTRANAIVEEVQGEAITANDCSSDHLRGLKVFGKSEQMKTTGAQKLPYPYMQTTRTTNGITYTDNGDGSITISGTATANAYMDLFNAPLPEISGVHFLSGVSGAGYKMYAYTGGAYKEDNGNGVLLENGVTSVHIVVALGSTVNTTLYPMLSEGETALPWEPYSGGVASPSPEYPQEINHVGNPSAAVCGKNLIESYVDGTKEQNGVTFTVNDNGSITINGTATEAALFNMVTLYDVTPVVRPGAEYIISGATDVAAIQVWEWQDKWVQRCSTSGEKAFTLSEAAKGILIRYVVNPGLTANNLTVYPMLRLASDADSTYEQGKAEQTMKLPYILHGIPVSNGGNYTDANGQQWICDEVDLARGVYVQRIGITDLTEAEWTQNSNGKYFSGKNRGIYSSAYRVLCTHINGGTASDGNGENVIFINANNDIRLNITLDNNTVEAATHAMNGATLIGVLATPIETALTDAEIVAFKALHSNYPNTTVLNDAGAWMEVAYNADTGLYFNNHNVGATDEQVQKSVDTWLTAHFADAEEVSF